MLMCGVQNFFATPLETEFYILPEATKSDLIFLFMMILTDFHIGIPLAGCTVYLTPPLPYKL